MFVSVVPSHYLYCSSRFVQNVSTLVGVTATMSSVRQLYHIPLVNGSNVYKLSCFS